MHQASDSGSQPLFTHHSQHNEDADEEEEEEEEEDDPYLGEWVGCSFFSAGGSPSWFFMEYISSCLLPLPLVLNYFIPLPLVLISFPSHLMPTSPSSANITLLLITSNFWFDWICSLWYAETLFGIYALWIQNSWLEVFLWMWYSTFVWLEIVENASNEVIFEAIGCWLSANCL